jgi:hypothetical protein
VMLRQAGSVVGAALLTAASVMAQAVPPAKAPAPLPVASAASAAAEPAKRAGRPAEGEKVVPQISIPLRKRDASASAPASGKTLDDAAARDAAKREPAR